jgi:AhpC/TSA antioxidant enzyme
LSERYQEFRERGADVVAIGMGRVDMAKHFADSRSIPFRLLVDHDKDSYRALGLGTGSWLDVTGPKVWVRGIKGMAKGHASALPRQDPKQFGGVMVVDKGGEVRYLHRAKDSADNPPIDEVLDALP